MRLYAGSPPTADKHAAKRERADAHPHPGMQWADRSGTFLPCHHLLRIKWPSCMAAKRAIQAIVHARGMKYDCPIAIMPTKSRRPVNLLALVCKYSILCLTTYEQMALTIFTSAISPIIIHSVAGSFSHGNNLYPTAKTNTKSAKLSNLAPNLLSTPNRLARKPSSISVNPAIR